MNKNNQFSKNKNMLFIETCQNDDLKILNNINSIDAKKQTFNKPFLKKNKINLFNQNNIGVPNTNQNKFNHILDSLNNDCHVNYFYKTENNSQIFKQENLIKDEKIHQKRVDSCDNIIRENKSNFKFTPEINYFNTLNLNNLNINDNKTIKECFNLKTDYINIIEKLSNFIEQLEKYQKVMVVLKEENTHLKKILLNSNYSNKFHINNIKKVENSEYLNIIEKLKKELNNLKFEYENTMLKQYSENSDMDYVKLLKRNEKLNQEIFKLRNYIEKNINSKSQLSITNFSFEFKLNQHQNIQSLFKRTSNISNKNTPYIISKNNEKKKMFKNYYNHDNIISTIEKENKSLNNKVEIIENQLRIYLKNKLGNNKKHHYYNSYCHK